MEVFGGQSERERVVVSLGCLRGRGGVVFFEDGEDVGLQRGRVQAGIEARDDFLCEHAERIDASEESVDHPRVGRTATLPDGVEQGLHCMREAGHLLVANGGGGALERVGGAENLLDQVRIGFALELDQDRVEQLNLLVGLFGEELQILVVQIELERLAFTTGHSRGTPHRLGWKVGGQAQAAATSTSSSSPAIISAGRTPSRSMSETRRSSSLAMPRR